MYNARSLHHVMQVCKSIFIEFKIVHKITRIPRNYLRNNCVSEMFDFNCKSYFEKGSNVYHSIKI